MAIHDYRLYRLNVFKVSQYENDAVIPFRIQPVKVAGHTRAAFKDVLIKQSCNRFIYRKR